MNKVFLIGRLTKNPELRQTSSGVAVATFTLAVNRPFTNEKGEKETDFINIVSWRKQAENIGKYLTQGSQVSVEGKIQVRSYDGEDGKKRYITEVVADNVEFLSTKATQEKTMQQTIEENTPKNEETTPKDPFEEFGKQIDIDDSQLPF